MTETREPHGKKGWVITQGTADFRCWLQEAHLLGMGRQPEGNAVTVVL